MATFKYVGVPPQNDVRPTVGQDLVPQSYAQSLLAQNMSSGAASAVITAGLTGYATVGQANSAMTGLATPSWVQGELASYVDLAQMGQPNGPVALGAQSGLVPTGQINAASTQTWPKPFWSPGSYPSAVVSATSTPVQLASVSISDPGYPYVLLCFGAFDTSVAADDGTCAQVSIMQGTPTGTLIAVGVGNGEYYTGPTPGDSASQMFVNSASGIGGGWTTVPNWLPQNGNGYTSTVVGNYLQVPETMTATLTATISFSGAAGSGAKGAAPVYTYTNIVDINGNEIAQAGPDGAGADTIALSWTGNVVAGQLYTAQTLEANAASYATITAGTFTITPSQVGNTSPASIIPVSLANQLPITGPTTVYAMLSSTTSTAVSASTLNPSLMVIPVPWTGGNPSTPVAFDNVGVGHFGGSATTNYSYNHSATGGAFVIVDIVVDRAASVSSVTYGGVAMVPMTSAFFAGAVGNAAVYRYYLANVAVGTKSVAIVLGSGAWCASCSYSYLNVASFTYATTSASSIALSQGASTTVPGAKVLQSFGCPTYALTTPTGGTVRFNNGSHAYLLTQEASASTTFGAASSLAQAWGGIETVLLP